ncbi:hypothetical protein [Empedobacter brevis]|uniref:hypothetical protein n=1 Tax=Empedobacter brevis TaxID=247 RepID=UPI0028B0ACCF|nr:hypothetical protein [Empedobacter brevis]
MLKYILFCCFWIQVGYSQSCFPLNEIFSDVKVKKYTHDNCKYIVIENEFTNKFPCIEESLKFSIQDKNTLTDTDYFEIKSIEEMQAFTTMYLFYHKKNVMIEVKYTKEKVLDIIIAILQIRE